MPAEPSGFVQRRLTCPGARKVSPLGRVTPARSTVYGVGSSEPPANALDAPRTMTAHSTSETGRAYLTPRKKGLTVRMRLLVQKQQRRPDEGGEGDGQLLDAARGHRRHRFGYGGRCGSHR